MALVSTDIEKYLKLVPILKSTGHSHVDASYELEADILYVSFYAPARPAADSELTDDDVIIRYDDQDQVIGLTILHASKC